MNKLFTFLISIAISTSLIAQTTVSGSQSGTWAFANSPYQVTGDITIPSGETLIIEAGVEVNFQGHYKILVSGDLQAVGTETDSIFFTTDNQPVGWGGIHFETSEISSFLFCRFEYGKTDAGAEYPDIHGGAVRLIASDVVFSNCVFADNDASPSEGMGGAVYCINTGSYDEPLTFFTDCKFLRNQTYSEGGAIKFTADTNSEILRCEFVDNNCNYGGGAISFYGVVDTKITQCLFANNYTMYANGGAIHMLGFSNSMVFSNCTITENSAVTGDGGGVYIVNGVVDFVNCIVYNNDAMYGGTQGDNVYVYPDGSTADINYSNLIMPEYGSSGANNINVNPLFIDAVNGNFYLQEASECIDTGLDIGIEFIGDAPDMGCFEYGMPNSIKDYLSDNLLIYPNPSNGLFMIENTERVESFTISDISGKVILKKQIFGKSHIEINISDFTKGIYFMNILFDNNSISTYKIILSK